MKLFQASSKISSKAYGELTVNWYVSERLEEIDIKPLIKADFDNTERYAGHFMHLDGCFTENEVAELKEYLKRVHGDELTIVEAKIPEANEDVEPLCWMGEGEGHRKVYLAKDKGYNLSFDASAHFYLFENMEPGDDPDFDITWEGGFVATSGGEPIGMTDNEFPAELLLDYITKRYKKNDEDIPDASRIPDG